MKQLIATMLFVMSATIGMAQTIGAAEYFIDSDPGAGNGVPIAVSTGSTVNFTASIPTATLPNGFHVVGIRTQYSNGQWGLYESRGFYISTATANAADIAAAEYFVDNDPGVGNGTPISPIGSGSTVNFTAPVATNALAPGFHFLAIRSKDNNGQWGLYESRGFYISTATANAANITAAEYFVDNDPGMGNGTPISPIGSGSTVNFTASVATNALAPGFHFLAIRTKDAEGNWGLYENRGFFISTATANMPDMTAAEYFIDTDPGVGNATPIGITPGNSFSQQLPLLIPLGTSQGSHFIAVRFKDADGHWGLYDFDTITVSGTIPVTGLTFTAQKWQDKVALQWFTLTEYNSSYFELERSDNGNRFVPIFRVAAAGSSNTRRDYNHTDAQPLPKLNYYRIRQVDMDGKVAYSAVQLVRMGKDKPFTVFPTITSGKVTITGINGPVQLRLYNAAKQLVHHGTLGNSPATLSLQKLPPGSYWLLVEKDGQLLQHEILIKQ
jgi:hypothetical protein